MKILREGVLVSLGAAGVVLCATIVSATTLFPQKFVCPIGGQKFTANVVGSYTSWGQRPDGREYGTLPVHPIVECPGNGYLFVKEKPTSREIALLTPAVASAEYQSIRKSDTPHYRAWWLLTKLGDDPYGFVGVLLSATWETDEDSARKTRYQRAFADAAGVLKLDADHRGDWFWLNLRAANAWRELGVFPTALATVDKIDRAELVPPEPDQRQAATDLMKGLRALIAEQNAASEPANLIPIDMAIARCSQTGLTPVELPFCNGTELAARRTEIEKNSREAEAMASDAAKAAMAAADAAKANYDKHKGRKGH